MLTWKDVEALNAVISNGGLSEHHKEKLRQLSVRLGMQLVSQKKIEGKRPFDRVIEDFKRRLYRCRRDNELTQEELGKKLNVTRNSVFLWEHGENYPTFDKFIKLCNIFNVEPNYLLGFSQKGDVSETIEDLMDEFGEG